MHQQQVRVAGKVTSMLSQSCSSRSSRPCSYREHVPLQTKQNKRCSDVPSQSLNAGLRNVRSHQHSARQHKQTVTCRRLESNNSNSNNNNNNNNKIKTKNKNKNKKTTKTKLQSGWEREGGQSSHRPMTGTVLVEVEENDDSVSTPPPVPLPPLASIARLWRGASKALRWSIMCVIDFCEVNLTNHSQS